MVENAYPDMKIFSQLFYSVDEDSCEYVYENQSGMNCVKLPKSITLGHIFDYSINTKEATMDEWRKLVEILQKNPLFGSSMINPALYIYEH